MTEKMIKIAGVRFRENWKVYDFDATDIDVAVGDAVIVNSEKSLGFAHVVRTKKCPAPPEAVSEETQKSEGLEIEIEPGQEAPNAEPSSSERNVLKKILRKATDDDIAQEARNREKERTGFLLAQEMISERDMPMKMIRVEYSFDASRAIFFFFSETRVDFRELVKDLVHKLKTRIEMRQIGVRDVARLIGGFGSCGRELCCAAFLKNFEPVSIRMAKKQEMVLNPAKISGVCGRLLCCLSYEYTMYDAIKKDIVDMQETAVKDRKEEDHRLTEEQRSLERRRIIEEEKRQQERQHQDQRRIEQRDKKIAPPETAKTPEPAPSEKQQPISQGQQTGNQPQAKEKSGKKKRRRFWRKKKKMHKQQDQPPAGQDT